MAGKFELKKAKDGQFHFRLKASNGHTIFMREMYKAKSGAENGIASVKKITSLNLYILMLVASFISVFVFFPMLRAEDVNPLRAKFKEIRQTSLGAYGVYSITNIGQRDIDDVSLSYYLNNKKGDTLSSTAFTDRTPGVVWLKAGESTNGYVPLDRRRAARELLEKNPTEGVFVIKVMKLTYMNQ